LPTIAPYLWVNAISTGHLVRSAKKERPELSTPRGATWRWSLPPSHYTRSLSPQTFKPVTGNRGKERRVPEVPVPEVVLHGSQIRALIGDVVAIGVSEHVGPGTAEFRLLASEPEDCAWRSDTRSLVWTRTAPW
jgi:hypothetical protein